MGAPPLTDIYGAGRGTASTAEWESESRVQQDVIRTEWHGQKSRLRGYELVTGQVSGCAERSSSKPARWHVADGSSIYTDTCNSIYYFFKIFFLFIYLFFLSFFLIFNFFSFCDVGVLESVNWPMKSIKEWMNHKRSLN